MWRLLTLKSWLPVEAAGFSCCIINVIFILGCTKRIVLPTAIARRDSVMSASAGQRAAAARAALLANLPEIDEIAPELAGAEPSSGVAHEVIDINNVAARLTAEFGAARATTVTRRAPSTAAEAANRVAAARLALAEAEKYQEDLDASVEPKGHRLLSKVPRLPESVVEAIVDHMGSLQKIMRATIADLVNVEGVGETRARAIKEGLGRLAETSILDRYG